jgi:hypothetical protein
LQIQGGDDDYMGGMGDMGDMGGMDDFDMGDEF